MHSAAPKDMEKSLKEGYEYSDMNVKIIIVSLIGLLILMGGACVAIVLVIRGFNTSRPALNTTPVSALATANMQVPGLPHLQGNPVADRIAIKSANEKKANSYGVISEEPGMERVHIPVDRAVELLAEGKIPYRQTPLVAAEGPVDPATPAAAESAEPAAAPADVLVDPFAEEAAPAETPAQQ